MTTIAAIPQHPVPVTDATFEAMGLAGPILQRVLHVGFKHPTPIQWEVIPQALKGRDIIGLAQTGSGKTAAFVIPLAQRLGHGEGVRGLILCPTREIALQTKGFLDLFGAAGGLATACLIGGMKMGPQIQALKQGVDIIVATPGRLCDHLRRGHAKLSKITELVLDEADHMLDLGFLPQLNEILRAVPRERHTMMFSATMPPAIERLARQHLSDPLRIDILPEGRAAEGIQHRLYLVWPEKKKTCLLSMLEQELGRTLVFTRRKIDAEWLSRALEKDGLSVERIHSDLSQSERVRALEGFRGGRHRILIATNIAARGIDVPGIEHIINFDIPETVEEYIHRAGRTARGAAIGIVSTIATWEERETVEKIEQTIAQKLPRCAVAGVEPYVEMKPRFLGRAARRRR